VLITCIGIFFLLNISAYFVGCSGIKAPKQAEKLGCGSVTPASVHLCRVARNKVVRSCPLVLKWSKIQKSQLLGKIYFGFSQ
jgi:hypothetical protein